MKTIVKKRLGTFIILCVCLLCNSLFAQNFPNNMDIIFLMDLSGSMGFSLDGCNFNPGTPSAPVDTPHPLNSSCTGCPGTCSGNPSTHPNPSWQRFHYVRQSLNDLSRIIEKLYEPVAGGGGGVNSVLYAIARFPGTSTTEISWLPNSGGVSDVRTYSASELRTIVNGLTVPSGENQSPLGSAIRNTSEGAINRVNSVSSRSGSTGKMIFLITDGKQRGGLDIYDSGYASGSGEDHVAFENDIDQMYHPRPDKIKIVSLGFGDFDEVNSETDFSMLRDISKYFDKYNPFDPVDIFTKIAVNTAFSTIWNTSLILTDPSYLIEPRSTLDDSFHVTPFDQRLIVVAYQQEPRLRRPGIGDALKFTIKTARDTLIDPNWIKLRPRNTFYEQGESFQMYGFQRKFLQDNPGKWKLMINADSIAKPQRVAYTILGYSTLQLRDMTSLSSQPLFTGDSLHLQVSLMANAQPIPDAKVTAKITGPQKGAGNWFQEFHLTPSQFDSVTKIPFPVHVENVYKKFHYMRHLQGVSLPGTDSFELSLQYNGQDSLYHGKTPILKIPGIYKVEVTATQNIPADSNWGYFKRTLVNNHLVKLKPDLDWTYSSLEIAKTGEGGEKRERFDIYKARFTPRDKFSNYLKPGKEQNIAFNVKNAKTVGSIIDSLEGSYHQILSVPKQAIRPTVQIKYDDFSFEPRDITDDPVGDNWRIYPTAISLHLGAATPTGATANVYDKGIHAAIDFQRQLNRNLVLHAIAGYSKFKGKGTSQDIAYSNISAQIRFLPWWIRSSYRVYFSAGGGFYIPDQGASDVGYDLGAGFNKPLSSRLDLELGVDYQNILVRGDNFQFMQLHGGILVRF